SLTPIPSPERRGERSALRGNRTERHASSGFFWLSRSSTIARFTPSLRHFVLTMSAFESRTPGRYRAVLLLLSIVFIGLLAGAWYLWPRFEREPPQIRVTPDADVLGTAPMEIVVIDQGAGLKSITATLSSGGTEHTLAAEQYAQPVSEKKIT